MMPAVDVKEEEVNKLSCSSVHVGGWSVNLDGEHYMHIYYFHMNNVHGHFFYPPLCIVVDLGIHLLLWLVDKHVTMFSGCLGHSM